MDKATLHAYVDGQLSHAEAAEVAQWLQSHADDAQRVLAWRSQRAALQGLHAEMLDEPLPPALLRRLHKRPAAANAAQFWRQALAAAALLGVGLAGGWLAHGQWQPPAGAMQASGTPAFVRDAAIAHVLYQPERRHPVEVGADQQEHLLQWLSKRLGQPLRVPDLRAEGFALMGGRLLPAGQAQGSGDNSMARAQFMYESAQGQRLTLYVSIAPPGQAAPTAFRFAEQGQGTGLTRSFYWIDGVLGYALSGPFAQERLARLGSQVYAQLGGA
ncbi:anti-sigma factor family protein [Paucibacter soli]|uniref:anti-sigma factor family protein n=1 Tax=Paucibacter soli TaxID=3133433 RepID=UPI0030AAB7F4